MHRTNVRDRDKKRRNLPTKCPGNDSRLLQPKCGMQKCRKRSADLFTKPPRQRVGREVQTTKEVEAER